MSYTPTTWANGDTITAQKMNNIEQGIVDASSGGGPLCCNITMNAGGELVADQTLADVAAALAAEEHVLIFFVGSPTLNIVMNGSGTEGNPYVIGFHSCEFSDVGEQSGSMVVYKFRWSEGSGIQMSGLSYVALTPSE